ncbi:MAG: exlusion protein FxsA [Alphaproteobacteria bacterium HGW-Alphaproteobacteria-6]|nr:MAG: exlusion protein FxsA [Alphaproteobacteria bacterium HGW-Alphaproteobacteria-6]
MWLLIAFIIVPLIEIGLFIQVGGLIGLWPTLAIVVATAVAGSWLVRHQGAAALMRLRVSLGEMRDPTGPIADGAMIILAGALLLTPGFFTDAVGMLLLVPAFRAAALRALARRVQVARFTMGGAGPGDGRRPDWHGETIDGAFHEVAPGPDEAPGTGAGRDPRPGLPPTSRTRH